MKQRTLFGSFAKEKSKLVFIVYKNPKEGYESFVERYCLRNRTVNMKKEDVVEKAQKEWRSFKNDEQKLKDYLQLKPGEKPFVRYKTVFLFLLFFSN